MSTRKRWLVSLIAALAVTALIAGGLIRRVDRWMQDWLFQRPGVTSGDIVIIGIDDEAFDALGPYNTWDRNIIASVLEKLAEDPEGCRVMGQNGQRAIKEKFNRDTAALLLEKIFLESVKE